MEVRHFLVAFDGVLFDEPASGDPVHDFLATVAIVVCHRRLHQEDEDVDAGADPEGQQEKLPSAQGHNFSVPVESLREF